MAEQPLASHKDFLRYAREFYLPTTIAKLIKLVGVEYIAQQDKRLWTLHLLSAAPNRTYKEVIGGGTLIQIDINLIKKQQDTWKDCIDQILYNPEASEKIRKWMGNDKIRAPYPGQLIVGAYRYAVEKNQDELEYVTDEVLPELEEAEKPTEPEPKKPEPKEPEPAKKPEPEEVKEPTEPEPEEVKEPIKPEPTATKIGPLTPHTQHPSAAAAQEPPEIPEFIKHPTGPELTHPFDKLWQIHEGNLRKDQQEHLLLTEGKKDENVDALEQFHDRLVALSGGLWKVQAGDVEEPAMTEEEAKEKLKNIAEQEDEPPEEASVQKIVHQPGDPLNAARVETLRLIYDATQHTYTPQQKATFAINMRRLEKHGFKEEDFDKMRRFVKDNEHRVESMQALGPHGLIHMDTVDHYHNLAKRKADILAERTSKRVKITV